MYICVEMELTIYTDNPDSKFDFFVSIRFLYIQYYFEEKNVYNVQGLHPAATFRLFVFLQHPVKRQFTGHCTIKKKKMLLTTNMKIIVFPPPFLC